MKIAFIGNNAEKLNLVRAALNQRWPNYTLSVSPSGVKGLEQIGDMTPTVIFVYPDFDDMNLSNFLIEVRRLTKSPLLVMGYKCDETEMVMALKTGADDYIPRSAPITDIMVRVWSLLRRSYIYSQSEEPPIIIGDLTINPDASDVLVGGERIKLTRTEYLLLYFLVSNRGKVVPHGTIKQAIWESDLNQKQHLSKSIQLLRKKIGDNPRSPIWISSVRGVGYRFIGHDAVDSVC